MPGMRFISSNGIPGGEPIQHCGDRRLGRGHGDMLSPRRDRSAMRNHGDAGGLGDVVYLHRCSNTAAPTDVVWLHDGRVARRSIS